jgi:hypothetical protein
MKIYPRANENRSTGSDPAVRPLRLKFIKAAGINFLMLQVLFLGLFCYLFGSLFQQNSHIHNLNVLFVDYDGGVIGASVRDAYAGLRGNGFPTLIEQAATEFPSPENLEEEVCRIRYWAAVYIFPGASSRLQAALSGDTTYNNSDVLAYIWNEARFPSTSDSLVAQNIQTLLSAARVAFVSNETEALRALSANTSTAISIFANPWQPTSLNIMPTSQGSRLIYNTIAIILVLLQEFFYLGTINGLSQSFEFFRRFPPRRIILYRFGISAAYTLVGALCTAGAIWAFRAGWGVNGNQFALTFAIIWLFAHINFLTFDVFTVWLPPPYVPMALVTWVVLNITSILLPFELIPGFYHWSYALPANELYRTLLDIWSGGCNPQLYISLPVLFSLEVVALSLSSLGIYRRCHYAVLAGEAQQKAFREKLDAALISEREKDKDTQNGAPTALAGAMGSTTGLASAQHADERGDRRISESIRLEHELPQPSRTRSNYSAQFAPCFDILLADSAD